MDYLKHYNNLIETRRKRTPTVGVYYEKHHIIMKSMGGTNDLSNIVKLTAREHFIAHWLLWRIYKTRQTASAFMQMCRSRKVHTNKKISSRVYAEAREGISYTSDFNGEKNHFFGKKHSEESKLKMSVSQKNIDRTKMSQHLIGRKLSDEHKNKIKRTGKVHSEETKNKMSLIYKRNPRKFWKVYKLYTPENNILEFKGLKELKNYFNEFNKDKIYKERISVHALIKKKEYKNHKLDYYVLDSRQLSKK